MKKNDKYLAIIIAAGLSSRMGGFKPLMDVGGKPALYRLIDSIIDAGIENIAVVTGYGHEAIAAAIAEYRTVDGLRYKDTRYQAEDVAGERGPAEETHMDPSIKIVTIYNADYESGMFGSVKTGIGFAAGQIECRAVLLFPVDAPLVSAVTIKGLVNNWELSDLRDSVSQFAVPVYEGKNGHPLLIPREFFDEILTFTGEGGLKSVRAGYDGNMIRYVADDAGCVLDMDTPKDYAELIEYDRRQK